jgi:hypothetical protein
LRRRDGPEKAEGQTHKVSHALLGLEHLGHVSLVELLPQAPTQPAR